MLQRRDEYLAAGTLGTSVLRTYNSQGQWDDDNGDGFRYSFNQRVRDYDAGVSVVRVNGDGLSQRFGFDAARDLYVSNEGTGAHDTLQYNVSLQQWTYVEGSSGVTEVYGWDGNAGLLQSQVDRDGQGIIAISYDTQQRVIAMDDSAGVAHQAFVIR